MFASRAFRLTILFLAVAVAYGASRQIRVISDTNLNYAQTRALALHGDIDLDRYGPQGGFVRSRGGHLYSVYGVGVSLLPVPVFAILARLDVGPSALHAFASIPFAAGACIALFVLLNRLFGRGIAVGGTIVFAFGTTMWPIGSTAFWQHPQVALMSALGLMAFFSDHPRAPFWAGLAFGWSVFVRPPMAIPFAIVGLYYVARSRRLRASSLYLVGALAPLAGTLISNQWIWGTWIGGYGTSGVGFDGDIVRNGARLLFGWWRGLLPYSPVLGLAAVGVALAPFRLRDEVGSRMVALAAMCVAMTVFYAKWSTWHGGLNQFGYRYLLDVVPALVLLVAYAVANMPRLRIPAVALGSVSVMTMAAGSVPDSYWWDPILKVFARGLGDSPLGLAWEAAVRDPGPWLWRVALVVIVGAVALWSSVRTAPDVTPSPTGVRQVAAGPMS